MSKRLLSGVEALARRYDGFLIDQFGVLHDGVAPYPGAKRALELLGANGKPVVVLSNSGRRSAPNESRLARIGIPRQLYLSALTSGETAWEGLRTGDDPVFRDLGRRCLFFARDGDRSAVEGLELDFVDQPENATFVFLTGIDPTEEALERADRMLTRALRLGLPVVCTNPDRVVIEGERHVDGPGAFAERYASGGGEVRYVGKPGPAIFRSALRLLNLPAKAVVMVGDSLEHDIIGASSCGIDGALVTSGVHRDAFAGARDRLAVGRAADRLVGHCAAARPRWLLEGFRPAPAEELAPA